VKADPTDPPTSCVVLDIDGVLADVRHRLHHIERRPKDWDAFFAAAPVDRLLDVGADFARRASSTHVVVYLTGRPDWLRRDTQRWLDQHGLPQGRLLMRPKDDRRPAAVIKLNHLRALRKELPIDLVVDDDKAVLDAARRAGFNVQLADWMSRDGDALADAQEREGRT
jgi:hypothetical protein